MSKFAKRRLQVVGIIVMTILVGIFTIPCFINASAWEGNFIQVIQGIIIPTGWLFLVAKLFIDLWDRFVKKHS